MATIRVHEFITADGVFENPAFTMPYGFTERMGEVIGSLTAPASDILLGRNTFEMFGPAWSTRTVEDDPGAGFFNDSPKHVVSSTLTDAGSWQNSTVLGAYDPATIADLKDRAEGDIYISGSGRLVRAMLSDGLVDELHLLVYPVILGAGARLFDGIGEVGLQLLDQEAFDNGVVHLSYGPA
ncbi:dihydrofolate reductase family protein [Gordonia sp. VNQ95]|jgi:dihydrofolate reductase|uniref:dihydrofolate reductase family protein n=1 Tax=Gordonia TaxID=2053 RepID=UPI0032B4CDFA